MTKSSIESYDALGRWSLAAIGVRLDVYEFNKSTSSSIRFAKIVIRYDDNSRFASR
jgi:hypothetical protein